VLIGNRGRQSWLYFAQFHRLGYRIPQLLAPFVAGLEFFGGILLLLGLCTRIIAVPLAMVMIVATIVDKAKEIVSLATYTDLIETVYMAVFLWLAVAGAGALSLDRFILQRREIGPLVSSDS
jgi:putative oxidoreductase